MANLFTNFFDKLIAKRVNDAVDLELKKKDNGIVFSGLPGPYGYRSEKPLEKPISRGVGFHTLRAFAEYYPIARACINYRQAQLTQLDWDIAVMEDDSEDGKTEVSSEQRQAIKDIKSFFRYPQGSRGITFSHFLKQILEDVLVIDAAVLYKKKTFGGDVLGYLPVDGATMKLRINEDGTIPEPPEIAYVQVIKGKEVAKLTTDEMYYRIMNPRTTTPYGLSPLETLILTVTTALKLQTHNLSYLTEGTVPSGLVELPKDIAGSPDEVSKWQKTWDSMMAGDQRMLSRLRFLPEGMKYTPTKKAEDMSFERFERWLLQNTCTVFGVPPQNIGFTYEVNRATGEVQWEVGKERGLFPLANFIKNIFDEIIQVDFAREDLEFIWTNINPTNAKEEAEVFRTLVETGAVSVDEWRQAEGREPIGLGHYVKTGGGIKLVSEILESGTSDDTGGQNDDDDDDKKKPKKDKDEEDIPDDAGDKGKKTKPKDLPDAKKVLREMQDLTPNPKSQKELRKWKKAAIHDLNKGRPFRKFETSVVDERTQDLIKDGLKFAKTTQNVNDLFEPFLSSEARVVNAVLNLYEDVNGILENQT